MTPQLHKPGDFGWAQAESVACVIPQMTACCVMHPTLLHASEGTHLHHLPTSGRAKCGAVIPPAVLCGAVIPWVVHEAPDRVDEAGGVHRDVEVVCLLRIQGVVLALRWQKRRLRLARTHLESLSLSRSPHL